MPFPSQPRRNRFDRRQALRLLGAGGLSAGAAMFAGGCTITKGTPPIASAGLDKKPAPGRKVNITVYSAWGGPTGEGMVKLCERFERSQPDIGVRVIFAPTVTGSSAQPKLFTAIAGGTPPDVGQLVPSQGPQWAELGIMRDLTDWFKRDGLKQEDFYKPVWDSMVYQDRIWHLQWDADPNFPFFWNKTLFEESGLDPEQPPTTIDEVDEFSRKLNKRSGGNIVKIGMVPWNIYEFANSMFTWGWAFGGQFYDPQKDEVTADDDNVIHALEWMTSYANNVGGADRVTVAPPGLQTHVFGTGNLGCAPLVATDYGLLKDVQKDMKIGSGLLPYQPPGGNRPGQGAWIGGWSMFIPKDSRNPEEAWEFIKWVAASPEGSTAMFEEVGFPSGYRPSPSQRMLEEDPVMGPFYEVLTTATNVRPNIPVADFYIQQIEDNISRAIYGQLTPSQALRKIKSNTDGELERFRKEVR